MFEEGASSTRENRRGTLLIGVVALLPLMGLTGLAFLSALSAYRTIDEERLQYTARAGAAAVDAQLGTYITALEVLATSNLLDGPLDVEAFEARARDAGERLGGGIVLIDAPPDYKMLANTRRQPGMPLPRDGIPGREQILAGVFASGMPAVSDLFTGAITGRPTLAAMVPVDRPGQSRRVLSLAFTPSTLRKMLEQLDLPPTTSAAIADSQMRIVALSSDLDGRQTGVRVPEWITAAIEGSKRALIVGPGWSVPDNVYAVERVARAPGWAVGTYTRRATQQASGWAALRWLLAGGAALAMGLAVVVWAIRREALHDARRETEVLRIGRAQVERLHAGLPSVLFLRELRPDGSNRLVYRGGDLKLVTGWPASTFAGADTLLSHLDLGLDDHLAFYERVAREGAGTIEYRMRQPDGSWRALRSQCRVLARRQDGSCEIVGYILDVSAERDAQASALAAARLATLGEMAAGMAHELNQPLATIAMAANNALDGLRTIQPHEANVLDAISRLDRILSQVSRAVALIVHLQRFARGAEDGEPQQSVPLTAAVDGALELMRSALCDASIRVEVDLGDLPLAVYVHENPLEQVLCNLLLNARDALAARPAGTPRRIRITAEPGEGGMVRLTVADTGGGIAPEIMARLFEPFATTKGPDKGTGLGLSICYGLVNGMGGSIAVQNDAEGAVVTIILQSAEAGEATTGQK